MRERQNQRERTGAAGGDRSASTLLDQWCAWLEQGADEGCLTWQGQTWTRAQLDGVARRFAAEQDIRPGQAVALQLQNTPLLVAAALGTWLAGGIVVCVNPMYQERELAHLIDDSGAVLLLTEPATVPAARAAAQGRCRVVAAPADGGDSVSLDPGTPAVTRAIEPSDPALITYTSGTTGPAKGAVATHANLAHGVSVYRDAIGVRESSVILAMAPMTHVTGMVGHLALALSTGGRLVVDGRFDAERMLSLMTSERVTFTIAALTAYKALLALPDTGPPPSLEALYSGGAPVAPAVARRVRERFGVPLGNAYGLTETTSISHLTPPGAEVPVDPDTGAFAVGFPSPGNEAWIERPDGSHCADGEAGELVVRGPSVIARYWNQPEATAHAIPDGALHTGDVACRDEAGWFYIVDRMKDQINASGFKVWPREIEDVLAEHPDVHEVAVVGIPDEYRGETVKAVVSRRDGAIVDAEELQRFTRSRLAGYKVPRTVEFVDQLPKTFSGKVLRRAFRDEGEERRDEV